jgi:putative endonuclease
MSGWYVYILRCADHSLYTGTTTDPERRLHEHNHDDRLGAAYTRVRRPVSLLYKERCADRSAALRREHEIRQLRRKEKLHLAESQFG